MHGCALTTNVPNGLPALKRVGASRMTPFQREVYRVVRAIPHGTVVSYGGVAALIGQPRAARGVGTALSALKEPHDVPWWRVVNRNGAISTSRIDHTAQLQRALLEGEDIEFSEFDRISWKRFGWDGSGV